MLLALILSLPAAASASPGASSRRRRSLGLALLALGVGMVTLAETRIDSSIAAMIAGSVPLQVILLRTLARERVALATRLSVLVGLAGLALIVIPGGSGASSASAWRSRSARASPWSLGSFFAHRLPLPRDGFVATTWQMLSAGVILLVLGAATGEPWTMDRPAFTPRSRSRPGSISRVFGSLIALHGVRVAARNAPISKVVTHQYVNPLVAIALGALLLDEQLTPRSASARR